MRKVVQILKSLIHMPHSASGYTQTDGLPWNMNAWNSRTPMQNLNYLSHRSGRTQKRKISKLLHIPPLLKMGLKSQRQDVYSPALTEYLYEHSDSRQVNDANGALVID
jgi:hypothetical protein